ncbi:hypothetical protein DOS84_15100 [Flavobacterium aquariorum]|uniref:Uncharacterized protein n=1 Tax=Flavobacterium aquariorum TaxID=2217670 RepID=A0A2W7UB51_9FLAO|nr:hypothetical protein DOS84_15100 [Flavobacterium aquariorum]
MIQFILICTSSGKSAVPFDKSQKNKTEIDILKFLSLKINSFDIVIRFSQPIIEFRSHDYRWINCNSDRIVHEFCPKIIKLKGATLVRANRNIEIWEVNKKIKTVLLWVLIPRHLFIDKLY